MTEEEIKDFCDMKAQLEPENEDIYKTIVKALEQETCEDAVSRTEVLNLVRFNAFHVKSQIKAIENMPSVTPQEPNTWSLDDAREDFMHDVYNALDFLPTNEEANRIINIFDRVTSSIEQEPRWIPVTERLPKEHLCKDGYIEPSDYVLVWGDNGNYGVSRYWGNRRSKAKSPNTYKDWVDLDWVVQKPIAWMPLPEAYEGGE